MLAMTYKTAFLIFALLALVILVASWRVGVSEVARARTEGNAEARFLRTGGATFFFGTLIVAPSLLALTGLLATLEGVN